MIKNLNEYRFGQFRMSLSRRRLLRGGEPIVLSSASWALLVRLIEANGTPVPWRKLAAVLSKRVGQSEAIVAREIRVVQQALFNAGDDTHYIDFTPGKGYRFLASLQVKKRVNGKAPSRIPRNGAEFLAACRVLFTVMGPGTYVAILIAVAAIAGPILWRERFSIPPAYSLQDRRESLVVVPLSPETSQDLADDDINRLNTAVQQRLDAYTVSTPDAAAAAYARDPDAGSVARRFDAHFILTATTKKTTAVATLNVTLLDAQSGKIIWPGQFILNDEARPTADVISETIGHQVELAIGEKEVADSREREPDKRDWLIRAKFLLRADGINKVPVLEALQDIREALTLDANFTAALKVDCRARAYALLYGWSAHREDDMQTAESEFETLLHSAEPDQDLAMTGALLKVIRGDETAAEAVFTEPATAKREYLAPLLLAKSRARAGKFDEAQRLLQDAAFVDQWNQSWDIAATRGAVEQAVGDDANAILWAQKAIERGTESPDNMAEAWLIIASSEAELGNLAAALPAYALYRSIGSAPKPSDTLVGAISPRFFKGIDLVSR